MARAVQLFLRNLARRPQSVALRQVLFQVHLWFGLGVGLYVCLIGVTGAALVFRPEMQATAYPQFFHVEQQPGPGPDTTQLIHVLAVVYPGERLLGIDWPTYRRDSALSYLASGSKLRTVFQDPVTAAVIGELPEHSWITSLQDLHFDLLGGRTGRIVNGAGALCLVLMLGTGFFVWWPGIDRWRQSLRIDFQRGWKRTNWDTHSAVGFWLFSLLLLWAVTGVEFAFPQQFRSVVNAISPLTRVPPPDSDVLHKGKQPAPEPAALIRKAQAAVPGAKVGRLVLPATDRAATLVLMAKRIHGDFDTSDEVLLYFDQYTGELIERREQSDIRRTAGDWVMATIGPLHVGSFGGPAVKILWAIFALSFPLLFVTGSLMWWNRVIRRGK